MQRRAGFTLIELLVALFITAIMFAIGYRALDQAFRNRTQLEEQSARLIAVQQALRTMEQDFELMQPRPVRNLLGDGYLPAILSAPSAVGLSSVANTSSSSFGGNSVTMTSPSSTFGASSSTFGSSSSSSGGSSSAFGSSSSSSGASSSPFGTSSIFGASSATPGSSTGAPNSSGTTLGNKSLNGAPLPLVTFTRGGWTNPAGLPRSELERVSYSIENGALMRSYTSELDATLADVPIKRQLIDHVRGFSLRFMDAGHNWQTQWPPLTQGGAQDSLTLRQRPIAVEVTIELEDWGILMRHIEVPG
jgi:type II secretion system protein J